MSTLSHLNSLTSDAREESSRRMDAQTGQRSLKYIPALDGLRGVAILLVLLHHSGVIRREGQSFGGWLYSNIASVGWVGVDLFFVLSGFLIGSILLKSYGRQHWIRNFIARRALRVLPLYFVVIFFCFNVITWLPLSSLDWLRDLSNDQAWYWLHLANFRKIYSAFDPAQSTVGWLSTYWSLSIEEHFYLLWPLLLLLFGPRRIGRIACIGILGVTTIRICIAFGDLPDAFIYNNTFTRVDGLMLGSLIAWLNEYHKEKLGQAGKLVFVVAAISVLSFLIPIVMGYVGGGRRTLYGLLVLYSASVFLSGSVVWFLVTQSRNRMICRLLESPLLRSFGKYSYAMYVFNKPIIYGLAAILNPMFGRLPTGLALVSFIIVCALCWLAAWVSWRVIEKPFLALKRFFPSETSPRSRACVVKRPAPKVRQSALLEESKPWQRVHMG